LVLMYSSICITAFGLRNEDGQQIIDCIPPTDCIPTAPMFWGQYN
jgi:hypothetical protein